MQRCGVVVRTFVSLKGARGLPSPPRPCPRSLSSLWPHAIAARQCYMLCMEYSTTNAIVRRHYAREVNVPRFLPEEADAPYADMHQKSNENEKMRELALDKYESGDYEGAIAVLKEATWLLRNDALAFNIMGTCYMCLGKYVEAIAAFDKVLSLYEDPAVHFNKGQCLYHLKYHFDAMESFDKAIQMEESTIKDDLSPAELAAVQQHLPKRYQPPQNVLEQSWMFRGYACFDLRELEEALKCFQKSSELNPESSDALMRQSQWLGRLDEALTAIDMIISHTPMAEHFRWRGVILAQMGRHEDAVSELRRYLESFPDCMQGNNSLANSLLHMEQNEEAKGVLKTIVRHYVAFMSEGNASATETLPEKFKNFDDDDTLQMIYHNYAIALDRTGDSLRGLEYLSEAIKIKPSESEHYVERAKIFRRLGRADDAERDEREAERLQMDDIIFPAPDY